MSKVRVCELLRLRRVADEYPEVCGVELNEFSCAWEMYLWSPLFYESFSQRARAHARLRCLESFANFG